MLDIAQQYTSELLLIGGKKYGAYQEGTSLNFYIADRVVFFIPKAYIEKGFPAGAHGNRFIAQFRKACQTLTHEEQSILLRQCSTVFPGISKKIQIARGKPTSDTLLRALLERYRHIMDMRQVFRQWFDKTTETIQVPPIQNPYSTLRDASREFERNHSERALLQVIQSMMIIRETYQDPDIGSHLHAMIGGDFILSQETQEFIGYLWTNWDDCFDQV